MRILLAEQVWIELKPAGFGSRSLAYIVDLILRWTIIAAVGIITLYALYFFGFISNLFRSLPEIIFNNESIPINTQSILALAFFVIFIIEWSYPIYFELRNSGQTPGKKIFGLRVVDENGLPPTFRASTLRAILLTVDLLPGVALVALITMTISKKSQRLGDLVAKTLVIYDSEISEQTQIISEEMKIEIALSIPLKHYNVLETFLKRRNQLTPFARQQNCNKLLEIFKPFSNSLKQAATTQSNESLVVSLEGEKLLEEIYRHASPEKNRDLQ